MAAPDKILFVCTACGYRARIPDRYAGKSVLCPGCQAVQMAAPEIVTSDHPSTGSTVSVSRLESAGGAATSTVAAPAVSAAAVTATASTPTPAAAAVTTADVPVKPSEVAKDKLVFTCASCGYKARLAAHYAGKSIRCPKCEQPQVVAQASQPGPMLASLSDDEAVFGGAERPDRMRFVCGACGYKARIPAKYAGSPILCPSCKGVQIAHPAPEAEATGKTVAVSVVTTAKVGEARAPRGAMTNVGIQFTCAACGYQSRISPSCVGDAIYCPDCRTPQKVDLEAPAPDKKPSAPSDGLEAKSVAAVQHVQAKAAAPVTTAKVAAPPAARRPDLDRMESFPTPLPVAPTATPVLPSRPQLPPDTTPAPTTARTVAPAVVNDADGPAIEPTIKPATIRAPKTAAPAPAPKPTIRPAATAKVAEPSPAKAPIAPVRSPTPVRAAAPAARGSADAAMGADDESAYDDAGPAVSPGGDEPRPTRPGARPQWVGYAGAGAAPGRSPAPAKKPSRMMTLLWVSIAVIFALVAALLFLNGQKLKKSYGEVMADAQKIERARIDAEGKLDIANQDKTRLLAEKNEEAKAKAAAETARHAADAAKEVESKARAEAEAKLKDFEGKLKEMETKLGDLQKQLEAASSKAPVIEVLPGGDAPKVEAPRAKPSIPFWAEPAPKTDAPKTDAPKTDAPKTDPPKTDAPK